MADNQLSGDPNTSAPKKEERLDELNSHEADTADSVGERVQNVAKDSSVKAQEALNHVLQWLSTASNEMLGACLAGLGAITYLVLGRVGLVLIGIVGGVVLHATWEDNTAQAGPQADSAEARARRKREDGLNILRRVLDWRGGHVNPYTDTNGGSDDVQVKMTANTQLDFSEFEPATGAALTELTDAVIRDYVK